jgi:phosphatidylserine/phosphatidylglycerophosphate/cardiolipin synthase-like enzyme
MPILSPGRNYWCEAAVDAAGVLVDADDYFRSFYRAAEKARHTILLSGWQFDSDVELLRGKDAEEATLPTTLKAFLNALCARNPELRIHVLAWDFHVVFALEREWMQALVFEWTTHEHLRFHFDSSHVDKGCHHQKFVVIDGELSFLGGLDLCDHRWDNRDHREDEPLRVSRGAPHKPFHDVQVYLHGREVADRLTELFVCRWELAASEPIALPSPPAAGEPRRDLLPDRGAVLPARRVALSRTDPKSSPTKGDACKEIVDLYVDAITAADRLIYIETQYFSSRRISEALVLRMQSNRRAPLQIVLVLNQRAETLKEEIAVGLAQAKVLLDLRAAAEGTEHRLGVYYTVPSTDGDASPKRATYIHSKVMIVDDRFLNIGSANLTNRSGSVDTELNATFEVGVGDDELGPAIRRLRLDLLREHVGADVDGEDLVGVLDARARAEDGRLRIHPSPTERERTIVGIVDPQSLPFDPDAIEDADDDRSLFAHGIGALFRRLFSDRDDRK